MTAQTILIVDSSPDDLTAMAQVLGAEHLLAFAWSGQDVVAAARKHKPALLLLETELPDVDGIAVCRALSSDPETAAIPVVLVADGSSVGEASVALENVRGCLFKPMAPSKLLACVRRQLLRKGQIKAEAAYREFLQTLGTASHFRADRAGRCPQRMAAYAAVLAESAGWDAEQVGLMELAAALHDIGEIGVPDTIVHKPLKRDAAEWEAMKNHCRIGHDMLIRHDSQVFRLAASIALHHHEKWDGTGYPDGLSGTSIPEAARIVAVADVFDGLTMSRPYRPAWPVDLAMASLHGAAGTHLDPRLVRLFESILPRILHIKAQKDGLVPFEELAS